MKRSLVYLLFVLAAISVVVGPAWAQTTAGMRGTITDPTGAVVPSAKATITNVNTQLTQTTTAGNTGIYTFTLLPVGTYKLRVEAAGFKVYEQTGIVLSVEQILGLNVTLTLGAVTEKVEVTGGAPLVNTMTTEVGTLVMTHDIVELPLNTRNTLQLMTLTTGVTREGVALTMAGPENPASQAQCTSMSVDGMRITMSEYMLDGTEYSLPIYNTGPNFPNPDAIEEFRFITSNYNAEFGKNPGGVMNAITKSGTNQFHGGAWEFNRNSDLGARTFFLPKIAFLNQNQYGVDLGGRIIKNKLFVFGTYQGLRIAQGRSTTSWFPLTTTEAAGNLANNSLNQHPNPIVDPNHPLTTDPLHFFAGNIIPAGRIDHVATVYSTFHPQPNSGDGRWLGSASEPLTNYQWMPKADYIISDRQRLSGSFFRDHSGSSSALDFGRESVPLLSPPVTGGVVRVTVNNAKDLILTHIFSVRPNLINQFRFAWVYFDWNLYNKDRHPTMRDMGAAYPDFGPANDIPAFAITGRLSDSSGNFVLGNNKDYQFGDNVSYIRGIQSVKLGLEIRRRSYYYLSSANGPGAFSCTGANTGDAVADFLLGQCLMYSSNSLQNESNQNSFGAYVLDDLKLTRRLTLNLGVRWERYENWSPIANVLTANGTYMSPASTFDRAHFYANSISTVVTTAPPGMLYPGDAGVGAGIFPPQARFEPRAGLAWDIRGDGKTSVRAGAGFYTTSPIGDNTTPEVYSAPFFVNYLVPVTPTFMNPFPPAALAAWPPAYGKTVNLVPFEPLTIEGSDLKMHNGSVYEWNLTVQHEFPGRIAVAAGWVANVAHHLMEGQTMNPAIYIAGNDPVTGLPISTTGNAQARRVFTLSGPQCAGGGCYSRVAVLESVGNSTYHSLQMQVRKEFSHGLTSTTSYTWAKALDDGTFVASNTISSSAAAQDWQCFRCEKGLGGNDQRHKFIESFVYNTPDVAQRLFNTQNRGLRYLVNDWEIASILTLGSGYPMNLAYGQDVARNGGGVRPNLVGNPHITSYSSKAAKLAQYFNTAAFASPAIGSLGNFGRNVLVGPGIANVDFSLVKNFPVSERLGRFQLRFDSFNVFNRATFANPGTTETATTTFGKITATTGNARIIQIGAKFTF